MIVSISLLVARLAVASFIVQSEVRGGEGIGEVEERSEQGKGKRGTLYFLCYAWFGCSLAPRQVALAEGFGLGPPTMCAPLAMGYDRPHDLRLLWSVGVPSAGIAASQLPHLTR
jgi:hypothetical protein